MQSARIAWEELSAAMGRRRVRLATAVIALVPLLYGALYLWAFWNPYERLADLPVALVDDDRPVVHDGKGVHAGKDLARDLLDRRTFAWHATTATEAREGLTSGRYYLALTIPRDFSADLASADGSRPHRATLTVTAHESANLLASQIGERVFAEVRSSASVGASKSYLDTIFLGFSDVRGNLTDAASGARRLSAGLKDATRGSARLAGGIASAHAGSRALAAGSARLADGAKKLDSGATRLSAGATTLRAGVSRARGGASDLAAGTHSLAQGAADLDTGVRRLTQGAGQAEPAAREVADGAARLDAGLAAAAPRIGAAASGAKAIGGGSGVVVEALEAYAASHPDAGQDPTFAQALGAAKATREGAAQLADGLSSAQGGLSPLLEGAHRLREGTAELATGVTTLAGGLASAQDGAERLAKGTQRTSSGADALSAGLANATGGSARLTSGAAVLAKGSSALYSGARSAASGAHSLASGLAELEAGSRSLATGLAPAARGSRELASGLAAGAASVPAYGAAQRTSHATMMSDPVLLKTTRLDPVPNYGTGFSPYFIPLALWVGALMTFFIVHPISPSAVRERRPGPIVALAGFWQGAALAIVQTLIMLFVLRRGLGLHPVSVPMLYAFALLSALTFVAVLQWLSAAFGAAGKMVAIVLLMLQLTSAAGTFPLETVPPFFQAINPFLPMTYVVAGLRQAISGGDWSSLGRDAAMLAVFAVGALGLTSITAWRARSWPEEKLRPQLEL